MATRPQHQEQHVQYHPSIGDAVGYAMAKNARLAAETAAADRLVAEARRDVHESLTFLAAPEADRVRALIAGLETAVEGRTAIRDAARQASGQQPANDQAHPPRVQWRVEGCDADEWNPLGLPEDERETAVAKRASWKRRLPELPTRLVRETTTWTVEEDENR